MESRNLIVRVIAAFGWLVLIYFVSNILIGGVVGAIAGAGIPSFEAGQIAGQRASMEFFQNYGLFVLCGQLGLFVLLAFTGKLPGTTKIKSKVPNEDS